MQEKRAEVRGGPHNSPHVATFPTPVNSSVRWAFALRMKTPRLGQWKLKKMLQMQFLNIEIYF